MSFDSRIRPHHIRPADTDGALVGAGTYGLSVTAGGPFGIEVDGLTEVIGLPAGGSAGETLAKTSGGGAEWVTDSVPVVLLPAGSTAADVPSGTPTGTIILVKA
jgi:hypothetical protein